MTPEPAILALEAPAPYDAFVSYRRADAATAKALTRLLRAFDQRVFLDDDCIPLGASWEDTIRDAAQQTSTLLVLWSRNAAVSSYMQNELRFVNKDCRVVPVLLDGCPLPPELAQLQVLTGLQVHERLISRVSELVRMQGMSQTAALGKVAEELRAEGVELTSEQRRAIAAFIRSLGYGGLIGALLSQLRGATQRAAENPRSLGLVFGFAVAAAFFGGRMTNASAEDAVGRMTTELQECQAVRDKTHKAVSAKGSELKSAKNTNAQLTKQRDEATVQLNLAQSQLDVTRAQLDQTNLRLADVSRRVCGGGCVCVH